MKKILYDDEEIVDSANAVNENFDTLGTRFCLFKADMPFYLNFKTRIMLTHGIEVEGVTAFPIPRKVDTSNLVLDSYEFIANEDNCAVEQCDRKQIMEYLEVNANYIIHN